MLRVLTTGVSVVKKRVLFFLVLNWLFFGFMIIGALLGQAGYLEVYAFPFEDFSATQVDNVVFVVLSIFVFNLALSGFLVVTLTGVVFFVLSVGFLLLRALLWGVLLNSLPTYLFLASFPTLVLEGGKAMCWLGWLGLFWVCLGLSQSECIGKKVCLGWRLLGRIGRIAHTFMFGWVFFFLWLRLWRLQPFL